MRPAALSIAGSDSGGGAGIQADLRTFHRLEVFGTTAITAVTAQNLDGVNAVHGIPAEIVSEQIRAVVDGFAIHAAKTGMMWSADIIAATANIIAERHITTVVDPVMVATSGALLLERDAIAAYCDVLIPTCTLLTPNLDEAAVFLEQDRIERSHIDDAARQLGQRFDCAVLLKGGHLQGDPVDVLWHKGTWTRWHHRRIEEVNTHGSGCMLSAAITAFLARGFNLIEACEQALAFVHSALVNSHELTPDTRLAGIERGQAHTKALRRQ